MENEKINPKDIKKGIDFIFLSNSVHNVINKYRIKHDVPPLAFDGKLSSELKHIINYGDKNCYSLKKIRNGKEFNCNFNLMNSLETNIVEGYLKKVVKKYKKYILDENLENSGVGVDLKGDKIYIKQILYKKNGN
jgi:hypothetical protein|tara:strand:+ start:2755 stop:3159 length:405 start_codon:yes stop_codon:yes gene_type:complete